MSNAPENYFVTPNHDLEISFTSDTLWMHAELQKGKIIGIIYLLAPIIAIPIGLFALFISPITGHPLNFSFTTSKIIFGLVSLFGTYIICLGLYILFFRSYRKKRLGFFDHKILAYNELFVIFAVLQPVGKLLLGSFPLEYYTPFFFLLGCWNFIGYTTYKLRTVDITVHKYNDALQVEGNHNLPLSFFNFSFLTVKHKIFTLNSPELYLSIIHRDRQAVQRKMNLNGRMLLNYQTLLLEEARNKAEEKNSFALMLTDKNFILGSNTGSFIGSNYSISLIEEILQFLNKFTSTSVIRIENKSEAEFAKFATEHPLGPSKRSRKLVLLFALVILIPMYILMFIITVGLIYLTITLPEVYQKLIMFVLFLLSLVVLSLPFFMYRTIRNAQDKQRALLDKYDIAQK